MLARRLRGLVRVASGASARTEGRLASVSRPFELVAPEELLRRAPGVPRGYWQRGLHWVAHIGVAAKVQVTSAHAENGTGPNGGGSTRFRVVREAAARILAGTVHDAADAPFVGPRFYGGFAFHEGHRARDVWDHFPAALFVVPALELAHGPSGATLTANVLAPRKKSKREALALARDELGRAVEAMEDGGPEPVAEYPEPVTTWSADPTLWEGRVEDALTKIRGGELSKVVLARTMDVTVQWTPDPVPILRNLRGGNPGANIFYYEPRPGSAFMGAAPELLGDVRGGIFQASAVAGSTRRGTTGEEDDALARSLLQSAKDRAEHDIVVHDMRDRLAGVAGNADVGCETRVLRLARIQHLERELYARLGAGQGILDVLEALHPTPAVCGAPTRAALHHLLHAESFERGWYAGPMGWFDGAGNGEFAPALRSAVLQGHTWRLFAGAGIVTGSEPKAEWGETRLKFEPILHAIGVAEAA